MRDEYRMRIGSGFDIHRTKPGVPLILGGVCIPCNFGLASETDGDVVLHAVVDAMLAAAALPDIGVQFPPGQGLFSDIPSSDFVKRTCEMVAKAGLTVEQVDITIIAEAPKLSPHYDAIRANVAKLLSLDEDDICVKARSFEGMGDIGEGRAIAAIAFVLGKTAAKHKPDGQKMPHDECARKLEGAIPRGAIVVSVDGGSRGNPGPAAAAAVIREPHESTISRAECIGDATNNVAEYKGVLLALRILGERGAHEKHIVLKTDSSLIYNQLIGMFKVKDEDLRGLAQEALAEIARFPHLRLMLVPREANKEADAEVNAALDAQSKLSR